MAIGMALSAVTGVFKAISKTKKGTWKAMKGAYGAAKGAAGPMASIAAALKVFAPVIKVVNALFKVLGASILKTVLPAMQPLLDMLTSPIMLALMEDIGEIIGIALIPAFEILTTVLEIVAPILKKVTEFFLENEWALNLLILAMSPLLFTLKMLTENWDAIVGVLEIVGNAIVSFINFVIGGVNLLMNTLTAGLWADIPLIGQAIAAAATVPEGVPTKMLDFYQYGTDFVPRSGPYHLTRGEAVVTAGDNRRGKGEIHVHIDLRNAVVDNVDRLSQKIAEQVLIQIG